MLKKFRLKDVLAGHKKNKWKRSETEEKKSEKAPSLFEYISSAVIDGELPEDFTLPVLSEDDSQIVWADGALDGVGIYHMGFSEISDESYALMADAVQAADRKDFNKADELFIRLGEKGASAISLIDPLQSYIMDHQEELTAGNIYEYGFHALVDSSDKECVKYGLSLLELFDTDSHKELKEIIRTIGLSDEFSIFAIFVMLRWEDGNNEVWQLAKKIHGWGRIHAVERLEPASVEIKRWLLLEGVHNRIMPAYSALTCWRKSDAETILRNDPTREEFSGIRDMIGELLDEGPVPGISEIDNSDDVIILFLNKAKQMASEVEDYVIVRDIRMYFETEDPEHTEIVSLCREILSTDRCREAVLEAVKGGRAIGLAQDLKLDYKEDSLALMKSSFQSNYHLCTFLMEEPGNKEEVMGLFRQQLPLSEMKTRPEKSLGVGVKYWRQQALEILLQELRRYPLEGQDFVETALQSAPIRTRHSGIGVLESWVSAKQIPLSELLPEMQELLCRLREIEPDEEVKGKMTRLIAGNITFEVLS